MKDELATRDNKGKPQWSLVDFKSLEPMVKVLEFGADRYGKFNWQKGLPYTETAESLLRHVFAFLDGEDKDKDSGIEHIGHIMCNAMFLSHMYMFRKDMDNRNDTNSK